MHTDTEALRGPLKAAGFDFYGAKALPNGGWRVSVGALGDFVQIVTSDLSLTAIIEKIASAGDDADIAATALKAERAETARCLTRMSECLTEQFSKAIGDAGEVLEVIAYEEAKGGGWTAILSNEYAALKLHYAYRIKHNDKGVRMYRNPQVPSRWNVSCQPDTAWMAD